MSKKSPPKVGYGNPPVEHRFKPGRSGNPSGRPKRSKPVEETGLSTRLAAALNQTVRVKINGEVREMAQADLLIYRLLARANDGCPRAMDKVINLLKTAEERASRVAVAKASLRRREREESIFGWRIFDIDAEPEWRDAEHRALRAGMGAGSEEDLDDDDESDFDGDETDLGERGDDEG